MDETVPTLSFTAFHRGAVYCGLIPGTRGTLSLSLSHPFSSEPSNTARATFDFAAFCWEWCLSRPPDAPRRVSAVVRCLGPSAEVNDAGLQPPAGSWQTPPAEFVVEVLHAGRQAAALAARLPCRRYVADGAVAAAPRFARLRDVREECTGEDGAVRVRIVARCGDGVGGGDGGAAEAKPLLLKMLDDPEGSLSDVELRGADFGEAGCEGLHAHRSVLAACSEYFGSMFRGGDSAFKEGCRGNRVVCFDDVSSRSLKVAVRYLYGDRSVVAVGSEMTRDLDLFLEVWMFSSVRLLTELEREMAELAFLAAHQGGLSPVSGEGYLCPALVRVYTQAVLLGSGVALARLAQLFEELLPFPRAAALHAAVMRFSVEEIEALLAELPPTRQWLALARAWLEGGAQRAAHGQRVLAAFAVEEMDVEELRDIDAFLFAMPYLENKVLCRIWRKTVDPAAGRRPRFGEGESRTVPSRYDIEIEEGGAVASTGGKS